MAYTYVQYYNLFTMHTRSIFNIALASRCPGTSRIYPLGRRLFTRAALAMRGY